MYGSLDVSTIFLNLPFKFSWWLLGASYKSTMIFEMIPDIFQAGYRWVHMSRIGITLLQARLC